MTASTTGRLARAAGARFERRIANDIRDVLGDEYDITRTQALGRGQQRSGSAGEFAIVGPEHLPRWPWAVECKRVAAFDLAQLWKGTGPFSGWWSQACKQADASGLRPLLVWQSVKGKAAAGPRFCAMQQPDSWRLGVAGPHMRVSASGAEIVDVVLWDEVLSALSTGMLMEVAR